MRYRFGEYEADADRFELRRAGERVPLEPTPLRLLLYLLERHPSAPSKEELLDAVWPDAVVGDAVLTRAARAIRTALGEQAGDAGILQTVRGRGFRIGVAVEALGSPAAGAPAQPAASPPPTAAPAPGPGQNRPFVGRTRELEQGLAALAGARAGSLHAFALLGEPGIGKTRTAEELAAVATRDGACVLWGRGREGGGAPPFWPWIQLLREYAAACDPQTLRRELGRGAADVATLVPDVVGALGDLPEPAPLEPQEARFRLFDSVAATLRSAARRQALVLVVDDLHWADEASLLLLDFALGELRRSPVLLVATLRDTEARSEALDRVLTTLARVSGAAGLVELRGLDREAVEALAASELREDAPPELVDALLDRTEGNPFFAREILQLVSRSDEVPPALPEVLPLGVEQVVRSRLAELPQTTVALLQVAAVIGREFPVPLLARATAEAPDAVLKRLEPAETARLVEPAGAGLGSLRFRHALIHEALLALPPSAERARIHRDLADALEAADPAGDLGGLAAHLLAALPLVDTGRAVDVVVRAAHRARDGLAFEEAIHLCEAGLAALDAGAPDDGRRRCALLEELADARFRVGEREASVRTLRTLVGTARASGQPDRLGRAAATLSLNQFFTADAHDELARLVEEALAALPADDTPLRVRLLAGLARQLRWRGDHARRLRLLDEAVAMARRLDDAPSLLEALVTALAAIDPLDDARRNALAAEVQTRARTARLPSYEADACWFRLQHAIERADPESVDLESATLASLAEELRHPHFRAFAASARAIRALWRGEVEEAERGIARAFEAGRRSEPEFAEQARAAQSLQLLRLRGQQAAVEPAIRAGAARYPMIASYRCALALAAAQAGRHGEASALVAELLGDGPGGGLEPGDPNLPLNLSLLTESVALLDDRAAAARLAAALEPHRGRYLHVPHLLALGAGCHYLGVLTRVRGEPRAAREALDEALAAELRMGARPQVVLTRLELARAWRSEGDADAAARALAEAHSDAEALGLAGPQQAVERAAAELG